MISYVWKIVYIAVKQQTLIYYIHCKNIINNNNWNTAKPVLRGHLWDKEQMIF